MQVNTTQLEVGDTVHVHGMIVKLDQKPVITDSNPSGRTVYAFSGVVANIEQVKREGFVPLSFMDKENGEYRWTIQGNDLANWWVSNR